MCGFFIIGELRDFYIAKLKAASARASAWLSSALDWLIE